MNVMGYARYSTDKQDKNSIAYQREKIKEYCAGHGMELSAFYQDEAESGTNTDRPGFKAMVAAAGTGQYEAVLIYDISRGSRDVGDWFTFRKAMMLLGVKVISVTQTLGDVTNSNDFLVELISVGMGQREVLETRQKSIAGVAVKAKEGCFLGGYAPLGYDIENGQYTINPHEAEYVRKIFEMYADGKGYAAIVDYLKPIRGKRGQPLGNNSISSILRNERYTGVYTWNKRKMKILRKWAGGGLNPNCVRIENAITPIIDKILWERVQARLTNSKRNASNTAKRTYLLSGLIECEACGAAYVGHTSTNTKGYATSYYVCGDKYRTHTCSAKNINANVIETFVVQQLREYLKNLDVTATAKVIAEQINSASPDTAKEKMELADISSKLNNGVKAILSGLKMPELEEEMDRLRVRKSELEEIIAIKGTKPGEVSAEQIEAIFTESLSSSDEADIQALVKRHITKIYAHADGSFTVNVGVHLNGCGGQI